MFGYSKSNNQYIMKKTVLICLGLFFGLAVSSANALCINCGCSSAYQTCSARAALADEGGLIDNGDGSLSYGGSEAECKQLRSDCHGGGVKIRL